jgi:membrane-bound serine protease (ClpP class)
MPHAPGREREGHMGEVTGLLELLGALLRLFGLGENAMFPALGLLVVFFLFALPAGLAAQSAKVRTGSAGMTGLRGVAVTDLGPGGKVYVHSEYWNAVADEVVQSGTEIEVVSVDGMVLKVKRVQ